MKLIKQNAHNKCAEFCCKMVLDHFNLDFINTKSIYTFFDMRKCFENYNLKVKTYKCQKIDDLDFNCSIIQIKKLIGFHFVCLLKNENTITVFDPGKHHIIELNKRYLKRWTGNIMIINNIL